MTADKIQKEATNIAALTRELLDAYVAWGPRIEYGKESWAHYGAIIEFINLRLDTVTSCQLLIENGKVSDSLGLCRSLLENLVLLQLMCRGKRSFVLQDATGETPAERKEKLRELQEDLAAKHSRGESLSWLYVKEYPRNSRFYMWVFRGPTNDSNPDLIIPQHYFLHFDEFRPDAMRFRDEDYFDYYPSPKSVRKAQSKFRQEQTFRYQHYLSWAGLLQCLAINDLADKPISLRLEAHYTFLGQFIHPTDDAVKNLQEASNTHRSRPDIGSGFRFTSAATLLAQLYALHLTAAYVLEAADLLDNAPTGHFATTHTADLRAVADRALARASYFWFVYNEAPLYDRFLHAIHHVSNKDLARYGGYANIPSDLVKSSQYVYTHFRDSLGGWSNERVGVYTPPIQ